MPFWGYVIAPLVQGTSCAEMEALMYERKYIAIMSEGVVPFQDPKDWMSAGCPHMVSSMIFREPITRLESHYRHVLTLSKTLANTATAENGKIDVQFMRENFDIISDNYYTRSLVAHGFYEWEPESNISSLNEHPLAWTELFTVANHSLHNIDWIMLLDSGQDQEAFHRDEILRYGLGLGPGTSMDEIRVAKKVDETLLSNPEYLLRLNSLDYKLWEIAIELNRLDAISIQQMKPFYAEAVALAKGTKFSKESQQFCCGLVCRDIRSTPSDSEHVSHLGSVGSNS